jgi:glucosylceramidase
VLLVFVTGCPSAPPPPPPPMPDVASLCTSPDGGPMQPAALKFGPHANSPGSVLITLDDTVTHQTIAGFGASFLEAGLVNINSLPSTADQEAVLRAMFDLDAGAGFSVMKTVIGATDYQSASPDWFTYDDTPGDTSLSQFSIQRDLGPNGVLTYIRRARAVGGNFVLQAPMDYPPDWMLTAAQDVDPQYDEVLANYYVKYVQAYEDAGVHIDELSVFNEPGNYTRITFAEIAALLGGHVGPAFETAGLTTHLQPGESGWRTDMVNHYAPVMDDPTARKYISTVPYHGYDPGDFADVAAFHAKYPTVPIWMTELWCCSTASLAYDEGATIGANIVGDLQAGASAWIYWNAVLDENGGPILVSVAHEDPVDNLQAGLIQINSVDHSVTYTWRYYFLAHFSKFVRPGAVRIDADCGVTWVEAVAFRNADGGLVAELLNVSQQDSVAQVDFHGASLALSLPAQSITTLLWR